MSTRDSEPVVHDLVPTSGTSETGTNTPPESVQTLGGTEDGAELADASTAERFDQADRGVDPTEDLLAPPTLRARAKSLWCAFVSGLG